MKKTCFLDRDGVLIKDADYLSSPEQVELMPGSVEALKILRQHDFLIIVVSNQSGVARGMFPEESIPEVHQKIDSLLAAYSVGVDAYYYCPHYPNGSVPEYSIECQCRKPAPGMIIQATRDWPIDLSESFVIGDKVSDVELAENAGCKLGILVRTGHGEAELKKTSRTDLIIADEILEAVKYYFERFPPKK